MKKFGYSLLVLLIAVDRVDCSSFIRRQKLKRQSRRVVKRDTFFSDFLFLYSFLQSQNKKRENEAKQNFCVVYKKPYWVARPKQVNSIIQQMKSI